VNWFIWSSIVMLFVAFIMVGTHHRTVYKGKHRGERHPVEARDIAVMFGREKDW
jgi:hypothetical protein